jgi:hypothetical protein
MFSASNPLENTSLRTIKFWLYDHARCLSNEQSALPTRLLALQSLPNAGDLAHVNNDSETWRRRFRNSTCRLVETSTDDKHQYAALSYCWGKSLPFITEQSSLQQHLQEISFEELPRTLPDSIMMARYLEFDYIWIDCLCIVQDDREDWNREAARMANVYSYAALTIAAGGASDCNDGFLHDDCIMAPWVPVCFEDADGPFELAIMPRPCNKCEPPPVRLLDI